MDFPKPFKPPRVDPELVGSAVEGREALHKTVRAVLEQQKETNVLLRQILSALKAEPENRGERGFPRGDIT